MGTKLSRNTKTGNTLVYLMTKPDFFNLGRWTCQEQTSPLERSTELHTQHSPLRQETFGMGCVPKHLLLYYLNGSAKGRIKTPMVPGSLKNSTTCWTVPQSWLYWKGIVLNGMITQPAWTGHHYWFHRPLKTIWGWGAGGERNTREWNYSSPAWTNYIRLYIWSRWGAHIHIYITRKRNEYFGVTSWIAYKSINFTQRVILAF